MYFNDLDDIVKKYYNTVHSSIKMKSNDVTEKSPKFKVGDNVRIPKYENIFSKGYTPNWSEEAFVVNKVQNTAPLTYLINDLNGEEIKGSLYEKELQKTNQKELGKEINYKSNENDIIILLIVG